MKSDTANTFAALDMGSNSFHLLIARFESGKLFVIDKHKERVRLGAGIEDDCGLSSKAIDRALESLRRIAERIRNTPVAQVCVVGTDALRTANNADSFLADAEDILGVPIKIINGVEEARLIYLGVGYDLSRPPGVRLVVDIGGGSTELILGHNKPKYLESLSMGCISFSRQFFPNGVITPRRYENAVNASRLEVQSLAKLFHAEHWEEAVGCSGTIKAIEGIVDAMQLSQGHVITPASLDKLAKRVLMFEDTESLDLPGFNPDRKDVLVGGLAILHGIFKELSIEKMQVSRYALREGVIYDMASPLLNRRDVREDTVEQLMVQYHVDDEQARRVAKCAAKLLEKVEGSIETDTKRAYQLVTWAAKLHEIGLSLAHARYHRHSAYLLEHANMPGFSRQDQKLLSFLVLNHRRALKSVSQSYGFEADWVLVIVLRLACLFCRRRDNKALPPGLELSIKANRIRLTIDKHWLDEHPLTEFALNAEKKLLKSLDFQLKLIPEEQQLLQSRPG